VALEIRVLHRHSKGIREIARDTGSSRNTVRRYLRDESAGRYKPRPPRVTKLDPFRNYVIERLTAAAPERIPASVLLRELRERGYTGGYTMLKGLVTSLRPKEAAAPIVRFETGPGEQMQVDWAVIRRGSNRLSVFVATLGWSRASYVEFVGDDRVETLIEAHENAFLAFGGAPHEVLYDNMRTLSCNGIATVGVGIASIRAFSTLPGIVVSSRGCARHIGRRPRAKWSGSSAICGRASGFRSPANPGRPDRRSGDGQSGRQAVAARGGERSGSRHHQRHPGRTTGQRKTAFAAGPNALWRPHGALQARPEPVPIIGIQHPLSLYDAYAGGGR